MISFYLALTDNDYSVARSLFEAYSTSIKVSLDFQHFDEELEGLKIMYAKPDGGIILAKYQEEIAGCISIRKISDNVGELKRMYVKPGYQNKGIGKNLLMKALQLAKDCKYDVVKLDTLNDMFPAIHLYKQTGFYETPPYYYNPIPSAIYFEKLL